MSETSFGAMKKTAVGIAISAALVGGASTVNAGFVQSTTQLGEALVYGYYSTQNENDTYIAITNTDTVNGKVVKVRFHEARGSQDVLDFQVWLSPADVWTAALTGNGDFDEDGFERPMVRVSDLNETSCTVPAVPVGLGVTGVSFKDIDIDPNYAGNVNERLSEGYVELIEMASIPPTTGSPAVPNALYTDTKHVDDVPPPCTVVRSLAAPISGWIDPTTGAVLTAATTGCLTGDLDPANPGGEWEACPPSGGAFGDAVILNVPDAWAIGYEASPFNTGAALGGVADVVNLFPQTTEPVGGTNIGSLTARHDLTNVVADGIQAQAIMADLPDLSTPFDSTDNPDTSIFDMDQALAKTEIYNAFAATPEGTFSTDWVITFPTKKFHVWDPSKTTADPNDLGFEFPFTVPFNSVTGTACEPVDIFGYNRNETFFEDTTTVDQVFSPADPGAVDTRSLCHEANILAFNLAADATQSDALEGVTSVNNFAVDASTGWAVLDLENSVIGLEHPGGLPALGFGMLKVLNTIETNKNYGANFQHRFVPGTLTPPTNGGAQ